LASIRWLDSTACPPFYPAPLCRVLPPCGHFEYQPHFSDQPAQIVFTSGTEGQPKAILLSYRNLADVVTRLNAAMRINDSIREYVGVPVKYSFGLGRARAVAAAEGAIFLPDRFDPIQIADMLAADQINAISAVPSL
jgi:long-subunit acyl-CoA synthetase (AMP-forming)